MASVASKHSVKLSNDFISPFTAAVKDVFTAMVGVEVRTQTPQLLRKSPPIGDIASVMPMVSPQLSGQLVVSFTEASLLSITSKMVMEECTELDDLVMDTAGEITNMVTGGAKAALEKNGYDFNMARPETYMQKDFNKLSLRGEPRILVPYETSLGMFCVDLGFVGPH